MSQFAPEDSQGNIDFVSDGDITFESDRNQDGVGDLVFRTAGVERARIAHDGTGTGWSNVLGGSQPPAFDFTGLASAQVPTFVKNASNPILAAADLNANMTSVGWPWLIEVESIFGGAGPYGESYRCYYSSDHQTTSSAIGLLTAPAITGPWTDHGQVFQDATGGNQCENPAVIYDEINQQFNLYYHMVNATGAVSSEVEKLATMSLATAQAGADSWTISSVNGTGIVLDLPESGFWPGNGGWGYMRPFRIGNFWFAHYRVGGGSDVMFGIARSRDGVTWFQDGRPLFFAADMMKDPLGRFNPSSHYPDWGGGNVLLWHGRWWWLGVLLPNAVQYQSPHPAWMVMAPLSDDFRRLTGVPTILFSSSQAWESPSAGWVAGMGNFRYGCSAIVVDGEIHLAYLNGQVNENNDHAQAANFASGIGMAVGS